MTVDMAQQASSMFKVDVAAKPRPRKHDDEFARHVHLDHGESEGMKTAQALGSPANEPASNGAKAVFGAEQTVAEHLRQASMVVENGAQSRLYPESLMVIGYLSMLGVARHSANQDGPGGHDVQVPGTRSVGASGKASVIADPIATASAPGSSSQGAVALPVAVTYGVDPGASSDVVSQAVSMGLPACPWPRQLMRMTSNDEANTLWIRDYRISREDARLLASTIASRLGMHGEIVDSVVLNGHVVMRHPAGSQAKLRNEHDVG